MYYVNKSINNMDALLLKRENELERSKLILADHAERIRILELAIQKVVSGIDIHDVDNIESALGILNEGIRESHKIALKEYP